MGKIEIVGVGGPILDQVLKVSEAYLETVPGEKGGMEPIDFATLERIISNAEAAPVSVPGGSARNTLHGLSRFGDKCALIGMIGTDAQGVEYRHLLEEQGIAPFLIKGEGHTATVLSLVTPDGQRTFRTYQGASIQLRGNHLDPAFFLGVKLVHLEGYTLFNEDLAESAMRLAKEAGAKVSFDLASFEIVHRFKDTILHLLDTYVDVIFCNELEAEALTGEKDEEKVCDFLGEMCETAIVLMGQRGCWVRQGKEKVHCPAYPVSPLDTTGAGDLFASGFIHGYIRAYPIDICAHYGAIAGRAVVQVMGPVIPHDAWSKIFANLKREL